MSKKTDVLLSQMRRCIEKYDMIKEGDRVLCAVSGGKDSLLMCYGLNRLSKFYKNKFTLSAVIIDMGYDSADFSGVVKYLSDMDIQTVTVKTQIKEYIEKLETPCSLCARSRRAALCSYAYENGFNKLALGHTEDDAAETALMNLLYGGKIYTFEPTTKYDDKNLTIIRPLLYTNERLVRSLKEELCLPVMKNPCGKENLSERDFVRKIIADTDKVCRGTAHRIAKATIIK